MLTCRSLRGAVLTSGLLLAAALIIEALATHSLLPPVTAGYIGLLLLFAAVAVLGITVLLSLLPVNTAKLNRCNH